MRVEVLETLGYIKHEAELNISSDSDGKQLKGQLTSRLSVGQSTFRYSISIEAEIVGRSHDIIKQITILT
jgi:hypothetical protein